MRTAIMATMLAALCLAPGAAAGEATDSSAAAPLETIGGPFILVDQNGGAVTDEDYRGKTLLLTFGYTHCPEICPTTLMTFASALHALGPEAKKVTPVFVTLDPARDTPAILKDYVGSFGPDFVGLTGPEALVANMAARYRVSFAKTAGADYAIDHSAHIFIVGPSGGVLRRLPADAPAAEVARALKATLEDR